MDSRASWGELLQHLHDDDSVNQSLKCLVKKSLDVNHRNNIRSSDLSMLSAFLCPLLKDVVNGDDHTLPLALEGAKLLRNLAAGVHDNQIWIIKNDILLSSIVDLCKNFEARVGLTIDLCKTALQLLGNLCVCCTEGQERVWQLCSKDMFRRIFQSGNSEAVNITCMIVYTCISDNSNCRIQFCESSGINNLIALFLSCLATGIPEGSEWMDFLLEFIIVHVPLKLLWQQCLLCETPPRQQLTLFQYIHEKVLNYTSEFETSVSRRMPTVDSGAGAGSVLESVDRKDFKRESHAYKDGLGTGGIAAEIDSMSSQVASGLNMSTDPPGVGMEDELSHSEKVSLFTKDCHSSTSNKSSSVLTTDSDVYRAVTTSDNLSYIQRLLTEHAQCLLTNDAAVLVRASHADRADKDVVLVQLTKAILKVMNGIIHCEDLLGAVQRNMELLDATLALLRQLSVMDGSIVSGRHRTKLSKTTPTGNEKSHPFFGFKRDLVRLVANLSYRNPDVQNRVNTFGGTPLILNQCSIDHFNPYIPQWAVWAIRNLCERNPSNQGVIANLEQQGDRVDTHQLLEDFGCEVELLVNTLNIYGPEEVRHSFMGQNFANFWPARLVQQDVRHAYMLDRGLHV